VKCLASLAHCIETLATFIRNVTFTTCKCFQRKEEGKKPAQIGTNVRARLFSAGLLATNQIISEGPATGQLDQGFPWFSLGPEQMLSWYPNSTLHCMLHMQPSQW
jgi:hypothetical protein